MSQSRNSIVEEFARLASDAAGMATGVRREAETLLKTQLERLLSSMDMVSREEHEAVKEMAAAARDDNERLEARIAALEARLDAKA
jgi:BMFP domain-containing protein YqiC